MTSLSTKLAERQAAGKPIRVGLIGAGKFGSMFIAQACRTVGLHLAGIADISLERAVASLKRVDFPADKFDTTPDKQISIDEAITTGRTTLVNDAEKLIAHPDIDVVMECTGNPSAGVRHVLLCCEHKTHIVMVNVEADVLAGPLLVRKAKEAGIIYSMAYGDQPALIAELVDWARTAGFHVVCAGKGTKHLPQYHASTPDTVWDYYGFTKEQLANGDFNPQMFNSFLDGTKSALEMAAVANGCDLTPPTDGLAFPPCGVHDIPDVLRPREVGGRSEHNGTVEVISCLETDGRPVFNDLRWGVYVVIEAAGDYQKDCFKQYGLKTDSTGRYAAQYKPYHLIGLELGVSAASIMVRGEPTGQCKTWAGDVVASAKRDLKAGEKLDGEGGFTVYGKLMTARDSLKIEGLPIGLAHGFILKNDIKKGEYVSWKDVEYSVSAQAVKIRKEMESLYRKEFNISSSNGVNGHA
ncbi:putative homoserine dehydrogenase [Tricladium varicosporioides]|nr:putative homoserine dehydrogenase [Hymenoscyphus varicosporioides]